MARHITRALPPNELQYLEADNSESSFNRLVQFKMFIEIEIDAITYYLLFSIICFSFIFNHWKIVS